jgi:hypothetical protein
MQENPIRSFVAGAPQQLGGAGFQPYAAGAKHYGGGRAAPNVGQVSNQQAAAGYNQRDVLAQARRNALIQRAQGGF